MDKYEIPEGTPVYAGKDGEPIVRLDLWDQGVIRQIPLSKCRVASTFPFPPAPEYRCSECSRLTINGKWGCHCRGWHSAFVGVMMLTALVYGVVVAGVFISRL